MRFYQKLNDLMYTYVLIFSAGGNWIIFHRADKRRPAAAFKDACKVLFEKESGDGEEVEGVSLLSGADDLHGIGWGPEAYGHCHGHCGRRPGRSVLDDSWHWWGATPLYGESTLAQIW